MSKQILIEYQGEEKEIALMEEDKLLFYARESKTGVEAEQIYVGRVDRIMKGMEAAFVQIGKSLNGFLPFSECSEKPASGKKILVQVKKPPIGEKAAYLTEDISLAGKYVILAPKSDRYAVSRKIKDDEERKRLLQIAGKLKPQGLGIILRTESAGIEEKMLSDEVQALTRKWEKLVEDFSAASSVGLLQKRENTLSRIFRDEHGEITRIITNQPEMVLEAPLPIQFSENVFSIKNVRSKLKKSWQRKIWLDCGGFLVIDRTEAMTVIDVNSGKFSGGKSGTESTFLKLNLEAAREIARILRLRNIGGIVIIDFVDMELPDSRETVTKEMQSALQDDPVKCVIHGFTSLGLMEITRKKIEESLSPVPLCPHCGGTGLLEE